MADNPSSIELLQSPHTEVSGLRGFFILLPMRLSLFLIVGFLFACNTPRQISLAIPTTASSISGTAFYEAAKTMQWQARDSFALQMIQSGLVPEFLLKLQPISITLTDSLGKQHRITYFVTPDYLSIGTNNDWARVPLTPMTATAIADQWQCFLPTPKMVDAIYAASKVKLAPVPMYIHRDSTITMWQHHLMIEGQRKGRKGLIAGIKKDVVVTERLRNTAKPNRVAIYGWHQLNGAPIQPVYTGHVNWYVDYSHGIRLVYQTIYVDGKPMPYQDVFVHPLFHRALTDEGAGLPYKYLSDKMRK